MVVRIYLFITTALAVRVQFLHDASNKIITEKFIKIFRKVSQFLGC